MLKLINESLFNISTQEVTTERGSYFETTIRTSMDVKNQKTNEVGKRIITKVTSSTEDYDANNMSVNVSTTKFGTTRVSLRSSDRNKYDSNIYLVAIPFNGIICPIEKSFGYRIYKGIIVSSDKRNIEFNGEMYKKVAYMIVVPNETLFDMDNKHHTDLIELSLISYNLESVDDSDEKLSTKSVATVTFLPNNEKPIFDIISENCEPVDPEDLKGEKIFPLFRPKGNKTMPKYHKKSESRDNENTCSNNENFEKMLSDFSKQNPPSSKHDNRGKRK